jgi:hypothetical protein
MERIVKVDHFQLVQWFTRGNRSHFVALKHKNDLNQLINIKEDIDIQEELTIGEVWVVYQCANRLGIIKG